MADRPMQAMTDLFNLLSNGFRNEMVSHEELSTSPWRRRRGSLGLRLRYYVGCPAHV